MQQKGQKTNNPSQHGSHHLTISKTQEEFKINNKSHQHRHANPKISRKELLKSHQKGDSFDNICDLKNKSLLSPISNDRNNDTSKLQFHGIPDQPTYRPEFQYKKGKGHPSESEDVNAKLWGLMSSYLGHERWFIQKQIVNHIEYTVVKSRFNFDKSHLSMAVASSIRDRLIECFNDTNQHYADHDPKRVYYMSAEYLQGRMMQNILVNLNLMNQYAESLKNLGYQLEELYEYECDLGLGSGGLGRLAACFLDSMATLEIPGWGYGIRYHYGNFKQHIIEELGKQIEIPNFGYSKRIPWEIQRYDVTYQIQFYGEVQKQIEEKNGLSIEKSVWTKGEYVKAMAYDTPVPGYNTFNTNCLRLWSALPTFDAKNKEYHCQTDDDYVNLVKARQRAEKITSVLFYKDMLITKEMQEDIIKQQYFFCAASIRDIIRRFKKNHTGQYDSFPTKIAIQLNDAHPAIAIIELMRILIDEEELTLHQAWLLTCNTFSYTSHSTGKEFHEKWPIELVAKILPRHLEIINLINYFFLDQIKKDNPYDYQKRLPRMSIIEVQQSNQTQYIRMAYVCFLASHRVNGVSMEHTKILKELVFYDFHKMFPDRIIGITNGVSQRRWIQCANPSLADLITRSLGDEEWLINLNLLSQLNAWKFDKGFIRQFLKVRFENKKRLIEFLCAKSQTAKQIIEGEFTQQYLNTCGESDELMIDVLAKRVATSKRQILYLFYIILRYIRIKENPKSQGNVGKVLYLISGRAPHSNFEGKKIIEAIYKVMKIVNNDPDMKPYMKIVFIPNFNVYICEQLVAAADLSQHISTPGTEPSGTSNMKYIMNGGLLVGSRDGANLEIEKEVGQQNIFMFGSDKNRLFAYQKFVSYFSHFLQLENKPQGVTHIDISLKKVFDFCKDHQELKYINEHFIVNLEEGKDLQGICLDFVSYTQAMDEATSVYFNSWLKQKEVFKTHSLQQTPNQALTHFNSPQHPHSHSITKQGSALQSLNSNTSQTFDNQDWVIRQLNCLANCGKFSSDRTIIEYCDEIWQVQDLSIPKGAATPVERIKSFPNISIEEKLREKMNTTQAPSSFIKT